MAFMLCCAIALMRCVAQVLVEVSLVMTHPQLVYEPVPVSDTSSSAPAT